MKLYSPYNDDPFYNIKGEKSSNWFRLNFKEGKLYETETGYALACFMTGWAGVEKSSSKMPDIEPCVALLHIYKQDYKVRKSTGKQDNNGKWIYEDVECKASTFEKRLCKHIQDNPNIWQPEGKGIGGMIDFVPNLQLDELVEAELNATIPTKFKIETVELTGAVPAYEAKSKQRKSGSGYKSVSPQEKMDFIKKELMHYLEAQTDPSEVSLGVLVKEITDAHKEDEAFLALYFDLLKSTVQ